MDWKKTLNFQGGYVWVCPPTTPRVGMAWIRNNFKFGQILSHNELFFQKCSNELNCTLILLPKTLLCNKKEKKVSYRESETYPLCASERQTSPYRHFSPSVFSQTGKCGSYHHKDNSATCSMPFSRLCSCMKARCHRPKAFTSCAIIFTMIAAGHMQQANLFIYVSLVSCCVVVICLTYNSQVGKKNILASVKFRSKCSLTVQVTWLIDSLPNSSSISGITPHVKELMKIPHVCVLILPSFSYLGIWILT